MPGKDQSIISIIQDMIREGQSEETIYANLKELGVEKEKARKLLLIGQADIYPLIQSEVNRLVDKKFEEKKPEYIHQLQRELELAEETTSKRVQEKSQGELKEYEKYLENKLLVLESQINESAKKAISASDQVKSKQKQDEERLQKLEIENPGIGETKAISYRTPNWLLTGLGIVFILATAGIFSSYFFSTISAEAMIIGTVLGLIGVTLIFVSTMG